MTASLGEVLDDSVKGIYQSYLAINWYIFIDLDVELSH